MIHHWYIFLWVGSGGRAAVLGVDEVGHLGTEQDEDFEVFGGTGDRVEVLVQAVVAAVFDYVIFDGERQGSFEC